MSETVKAPFVVRVPPPVWALIFIGIALAVDGARGWTREAALRSLPVGIPVVVLGVALAAWARILFAREGTQVLPSSKTNRVLVTRGPFAFSRNPMYVGVLMVVGGVAIWVGSISLLVAVVPTFLVIRFGAIPFEEAKMERQFGDAYRAYKAKVRRWG